MAKPGYFKYDFSKLDKDTEFQEFLNLKPSCGPAEPVDMKRYEKGIDWFCEMFFFKKGEADEKQGHQKKASAP